MRVDCPWPEWPDSYIVLPDEWVGDHSRRYDEAVAEVERQELSGATLRNFAVALALLDDWRLPGLEGKPELWDFSQIRLEIIGWVGTLVVSEYWKCFAVPKDSSPVSQTGTTEAETEAD
jgi:hypothetical protein